MTPVPRKRRCRKQDHNCGLLNRDSDIDARVPGTGCERPIRVRRNIVHCNIFHLDNVITRTMIRERLPQASLRQALGVCHKPEA
jgi:hypothetical protein